MDAQARYPDWHIEVMPREVDVEFFPEAKMVLISRRAFVRGPRQAYASVVVGLDALQESMAAGGCATAEQEAWAAWEARRRLD